MPDRCSHGAVRRAHAPHRGAATTLQSNMHEIVLILRVLGREDDAQRLRRVNARVELLLQRVFGRGR